MYAHCGTNRFRQRLLHGRKDARRRATIYRTFLIHRLFYVLILICTNVARTPYRVFDCNAIVVEVTAFCRYASNYFATMNYAICTIVMQMLVPRDALTESGTQFSRWLKSAFFPVVDDVDVIVCCCCAAKFISFISLGNLNRKWTPDEERNFSLSFELLCKAKTTQPTFQFEC